MIKYLNSVKNISRFSTFSLSPAAAWDCIGDLQNKKLFWHEVKDNLFRVCQAWLSNWLIVWSLTSEYKSRQRNDTHIDSAFYCMRNKWEIIQTQQTDFDLTDITTTSQCDGQRFIHSEQRIVTSHTSNMISLKGRKLSESYLC